MTFLIEQFFTILSDFLTMSGLLIIFLIIFKMSIYMFKYILTVGFSNPK